MQAKKIIHSKLYIINEIRVLIASTIRRIISLGSLKTTQKIGIDAGFKVTLIDITPWVEMCTP